MRFFPVSILTSILLTTLPAVAQDDPFSFIGLRYEVISDPDLARPVYKHLPPDLVVNGGSIVGDVYIAQPWALGWIQQGNEYLVWFEKILSNVVTQKPQGLRNHQTILILDVVKLPEGEPNILLGCERNGNKDPELFAIPSEYQPDSEWITDFKQVWRANRQTETLDKLSPAGIRCVNPAWGI
ncbi:MAG: hypothetical protein ACO36E_04450 [Synechocystis sp.]